MCLFITLILLQSSCSETFEQIHRHGHWGQPHYTSGSNNIVRWVGSILLMDRIQIIFDYYVCFFHSFIGISNSLPQTSGMKMIEFWMIFTMMYPFTLVLLHIFNQVRTYWIFSTRKYLLDHYWENTRKFDCCIRQDQQWETEWKKK